MTEPTPVATLDPSRCPLCGESNACGIAAGSTECWCFTEKVPVEVLALLPEEARGVVCVCRACATGKRGAVAVQARLAEILSRR